MKQPYRHVLTLAVSITFIGVLSATGADTAPDRRSEEPAASRCLIIPLRRPPPTSRSRRQRRPAPPSKSRDNRATAWGIPATLVDSEDIARYKEILKTNVDAQANLKAQIKYCDDAIVQADAPFPLAAEKNADGSWKFPGEQTRNSGGNGAVDAVGRPYLSGDRRRKIWASTARENAADLCRQLHPIGATLRAGRRKKLRSAYDGRLSFQFLNDGGFLNAGRLRLRPRL